MQNRRRIELIDRIEKVTADSFTETALQLFDYQRDYNQLYREWLKGIRRLEIQPETYSEIPCIPIQMFKYHEIKTGIWQSAMIFRSSGTTGQQRSKHHLRDIAWYRQICEKCFTSYFGALEDHCFLALLPSYSDRKDASLAFMVSHFISKSRYSESGFFLQDLESLSGILNDLSKRKVPTILIGVSFALLDLADSFPHNLSPIMVMETGGMKGRRQEMIRQELHQQLMDAFGLESIYSEYGMTELLSQAYSWENGRFLGGPTLRFYCRAVNDPFAVEDSGKTGVLNAIDLGNIDTCAFIATDDLGKVYADHSFEVLGRMDGSEWRGCNLMYLPD